MKRFRLSLPTIFLILVALGIAAMSTTFVMTAFTLDDHEKVLADQLAALPSDTPTPLETVAPGEWTSVCVLSAPFEDPGKTRNPDQIEGTLLKPMRSHAVFLKSGYWVLVLIDDEHTPLLEYRVSRSETEVAPHDGKANYCLPRSESRIALAPCGSDDGCRRRLAFVP